MDNWDKLKYRMVYSTGETEQDPTIYSGHTGHLFGLWKYTLLLEKEAGGLVEPSWLHENLKEALKANVQRVGEILEVAKVINDFTSYYKSYSVGLNLLMIQFTFRHLHKKESIDFEIEFNQMN